MSVVTAASAPGRRVARSVVLPPPSPGFLGEGHTAIEVLRGLSLDDLDPFVLLMDDRLDLGPVGRTIGGAHPHAGLETVTLFLEGELRDDEEGDTKPGDAQWMTAGRGIIHGEAHHAAGRHRILQLWIRLPASARSDAPEVQFLARDALPVRREPGVVARVYSGASGGLRAATRNRAPVTIVDVRMEPGARFAQELPASYGGFIYVVDGDVSVEGATLRAGHVGHLDRPARDALDDDGALVFVAGATGARAVLYAGRPQREPLLHYGPFVAGDEGELVRLFTAYRAGRFRRLAELAPGRRVL